MTLDVPKVSVVIPTIGRGELLIGTVSRLLSSGCGDCEIIVVDQTPDPDDSVIEFVEANRDKIIYVKIDEPGLTNARNVGIKRARGDVVVFLDDDVVPDNRLVSAHVAAYEGEGVDNVGGVAGRILPPGEPPSEVEKNPERIAKIRLFGLLIRENFDSDVPTIAHHARGCNMSFLKKALVEAGGFDVGFGGTAHLEDADMSLRIRRLGYGMLFCPHASLVHLLEPVGGCRPKDTRDWFFWYGHNLCRFYRKNFPAYVFPLQCLHFVLRLPIQAVKRGNLKIILWGISGFTKSLFEEI
ncbi:MAG: glycosyltransferase family 2 protein [Deltaproteobacteria bacterium]|uniref:Glycosyltransferase family 2 protein n=1 Tax=Candidatus Zymogenus saltonus TaxID=2844893 RepID=A0A9D8KEH5_9DELT|nr:glycosyltransferase family 2 protein [Candidatus Zymogenus saltonus]